MTVIPALVTVVIVTRNRVQQLQRAIESVYAQDYPSWEMIVVDDASSDGTAEQVKSHWPEITVIRMHKNSGVTITRNIAIATATGEYIYFLDDDGWLERSAISKCVEMIISRPELGAVESCLHNVLNGVPIETYKPVNIGMVYIPHFVECCSLVRREAIVAAGYFADDLFWGAEGEEISLRMLYHGYRCGYQPVSIMYHELRERKAENRWIRSQILMNSTIIALRLWPFPWNLLRVVNNITQHALRYAFLYRNPVLPLQIFATAIREVCRRNRRTHIDKAIFRWYLSVNKKYQRIQ